MYVCMYVCMHACMHACMHVCMTDYKSLVTTLLVEQKLKGMRNDKTDSNCFNMHACMHACMYVCMYDRLQIARDNTASRTEVERNEERQNRLQLLQQNAAMYRENERLQHLQDHNYRDSYLSNGWRNAEQPLHKQQ